MSDLDVEPDLFGLPQVDDARYPNLSMLTKGCMSGRISEWPFLKQEANLALGRIAELERLILRHQEVLLKIDMQQGYAYPVAEREERIEELEHALQKLHDECCITKHGRLNYGPMMEPSEQTVLEAQKLVEK